MLWNEKLKSSFRNVQQQEVKDKDVWEQTQQHESSCKEENMHHTNECCTQSRTTTENKHKQHRT